jgi:hypothetical protein
MLAQPLATALANPLAMPLVAGRFSFDPDASAYITSLIAASATVTGAQRTAINDFFTLGKSQGWYAQLRRIYLPIWGAAAPNAIDMITRSSGTFVGGVTPGAGFVQGNGTTGYFDFGATAAALGLTPSTGNMFGLIVTPTLQSGFRAIVGAGSTNRYALYRGSAADMYYANGGGTGYNNTVTSSAGIFSGYRFGGVTRIDFRRASGATNVVNQTVADAGASTAANIYAMAWNFRDTAGATPQNFFDAQLGLYGAGLGMSQAMNNQFTAALATLWTTCTGLSLP